jgi:hypothetical protein
MQESATDIPYDMQKLVGIVIPVLLLGFVAIIAPFAFLQKNVEPPYYPPPPGWESSVLIYLWGRGYSVAPPSLTFSLPFALMTLVYFVIQIAVSIRKMQSKYGVAIGIALLPIWVSVCHWIYGTLPDWSLIQLPILPIVGISMLLVVYWSQQRR